MNYLNLFFFVILLVKSVRSSVVLIDGDILVDQTEMDRIKFKSQIVLPIGVVDNQRIKRAATANKERIWDYGVVPYVIDDHVDFSGSQKAEFVEAMKHWENFTCIKFVERDANEHVDFIRFTKLDCHCCSHVGKQGMGGQNVSIGKNCHKKGIIVHELGHALGFWHEHTRPDRDEHVRILSENILADHEHNFNKLTTGDVDSLGEPYDYNSIMHYARDTYSKHTYGPKLSTIQPKRRKNGRRPKIGQREHLSESDIRQTNKLYKCPECGRTFLEHKGAFTSPNYHNVKSSKSYRCEWRISTTHGERIQLNITDFNMSTDCHNNYLEIRDGYWHKSPLLGHFCGENIKTQVIMSTGNRMIVNYISNHAEYRGFAAKYESICGGDLTIVNGQRIESPNFPRFYLPNKECIWRITVPPKYQIAMEFHSFDLEMHPNCRNDFIEVRDGENAKSRLIGKYCGNTLPNAILASKSNKMFIRFVSDEMTEGHGFSAELFQEIDECSLKEHGCEQNCINTLDGYRCACRLGYKLRPDEKTCEIKCGGIIKASNGTIQSPSFPYRYPADEECVWEIISHEPNRITLNFTHFELEGSHLMQEDCDYDSVAISSKYRDGRWIRQGIFCSDLLPPSITSETNVMRIQFKSDKNVQKSGFSVTFSTSIDRCAAKNGGCKHICRNTLDSIECSCKRGFVLHENGVDCIPGGCRFEITATHGVIESPNYPMNYSRNLDCIWHFKAIHGHRPLLEFDLNHFDVEADYDECTNDYVNIYIGVDPMKRTFISGDTYSLGTFCGSNIQSNFVQYLPLNPIPSPSDDLFMAFKTDSSVQRKGFVVKHSTVCGGHFDSTAVTKYIHSHARFGDTFYNNDTSCEWIIKSKQPGMRIHLKFLEFDLEKDPECLFDYVEVYEQQRNLEWNLYGRYCGTDQQFEIVSFRRLLIRFETDDSVSGKGFSISYSIANAATIRDWNSGSNKFTRLTDEVTD